MYLKYIETVGFKSFADKVRLQFEPGITGVVGPNGAGKCVHGDTLIQLADGTLCSIRDIVEERLAAPSRRRERWKDGWCDYENPEGLRVLSLNPATLRIEPTPVLAFVKRKAPDRLLRIKTRAGREIVATHYHPLFTLQEGALETLTAEELQPGVPIALPRQLPVSGSPVPLRAPQVLASFQEEDPVYVPGRGVWNRARGARQSARVGALLEGIHALQSARGGEKGRIELPPLLDESLAKFLGYLISEGRTTRSNQVWFVNSEPEVVRDYIEVARASFGSEVFVASYKPSAKDCLIFSKTLCLYLERVFGLKVEGKSAGKKVPDQIFSAPDSVVLAFLGALFEGDGYLGLRRSQGRTSAHWQYSTASRELAEGVATLLLRFGVFPLVRANRKAAQNTVLRIKRTYYSVYVYGLDPVQRLARLLHFVGRKKTAVEEVLSLSAEANPNLDLIPGITGRIQRLVKASGIQIKPQRGNHPRLAAYCEGSCEASREGLLEVLDLVRAGSDSEGVAREVRDQELLARSDIYWDRIETVEKVESPEWVYDLCVAETHNFVANNFFVHNSNVLDAVKWCIGEMSWKSLRSDSMVEVIFSGTARRPALGMAEVSLTFDNASRKLPIDYSEITVTRRIFRSGESEYHLNKTQCRLRDIRELFLDTGLGGEGYALIDQGGVDFVLSSNPQERRAIFEEAAGVARYKAKREEALRKLEKVEVDVNRIQDQISLLTDQLKKLDSDARKARLAQKYKEELAELEIASLVQESARIDGDLALNHEQAEPIRHALSARRAEAQTLDAQRTALELERVTAEKEVAAVNQKLAALKAEISRLEERIDQAEAQSKELGQRRESIQEEVREAEPRLSAMGPDIQKARQGLEGLEAKLSSAERERSGWASQVEKLHSDLAKAEADLEKARAAELSASEAHLQLSRNLSRLESNAGNLEYQLREKLKTLEKDTLKLGYAEEDLQGSARAARSERERWQEAQASLRLAEEGLRETQAKVQAHTQALLSAETRRAEVQGRLEVLKSAAAGDPYWAGSRAVLQAELPGLLGTVRRLLEVEPGYERFVEDALGERLEAVVAEDVRAAVAGIEFLKKSRKGRARFLVLSAIGERPPQADGPSLPPGARALAAHVSARPGLERLLEATLQETFVQDGAVHGPCWVSGGALPSSPRETSEIGEIDRLETALQSARAEAQRLRTEGEELAGEADRLGGVQAEMSRAERERSAAAQAAGLREGQAKAVLETCRAGAAFLERESAGILKDLAAGREEIARLRGESASSEKTEREARGRASELEKVRASLDREVTTAGLKAGAAENVVSHLRAQESLLKDQAGRLAADEAALRGVIARWKSEFEASLKRMEELKALGSQSQTDLDHFNRELARHETEAQSLSGTYHRLTSACQEKTEAIRRLEEEIQNRQEDLHQMELKSSSLKARQDLLRERVEKDFGTAWDEAAVKFGEVEADLQKLEHLRRRVQNLGLVNMAAPEEYEELRQKHQFLSTQAEDLNKASEDLRSAISKINATTRENFRQTFQEVREEFRRIYGVLFDGGEADLVLTEPDNLLETGVEIVAQPPGKKLQSISVLSGGEKALTALALLFSFLMVRPSPFCMLDEADAALDEPNTERFVQLLKEFSGKTQFLIISHSKRTMEAADLIYGITMEDSGVSQVISVDFKKPASHGAPSSPAPLPEGEGRVRAA